MKKLNLIEKFGRIEIIMKKNSKTSITEKIDFISCSDIEKINNCPKCGFKLDINDPDTVYPLEKPNGTENVKYIVWCVEHYGGCGHEIIGKSKIETIKIWNNQKKEL